MMTLAVLAYGWRALYPGVQRCLIAASTLLLVGSLVAAALRADKAPEPTVYSKISTRNVLNRGAK